MKYIDFVDHIFRSQEYTEKLIFEEKPKAKQRPDPDWMKALEKQYIEKLDEKKDK